MKIQLTAPRLRKLAPTMLSVAVTLGAMSFAQTASAANRQLELVPDDTPFYFGTGKPVAVEDFFSLVPTHMFKPETLGRLVRSMKGSQAEGFKQVSEFFKDPTKATRQWGLGDELHFSVYAVGLLPVFRIEGDGKQFESAIAEAEAENDIQFDKLTHKDLDVRILAVEEKDATEAKVVAPAAAVIETAEANVTAAKSESDAAAEKLKTATANLDAAKAGNDASGIAVAANEIAEAAKLIAETQDTQTTAERALAKLNLEKDQAEKLGASGGKSSPGLVIAADGKDLIFAFSYNAYDPDILDQLLGLSKPEKSIEASGKVKQIRKEWGYGDELAMFVDFKLIADTVTGGDTTAAQQLKTLMATNDSMDGDFNMLATEPCRTEIRQLAENWPMAVSGNRKFDVNDNNIAVDSHFAMLIENTPLRDTLKLLRGVVPMSQSSSDAMLSFGVGIDIDNLPQLSTRITDLVGAVNYSCEALKGMNKIAETDLSPVTMGAMIFSGMARGIKGFSVNMFDADVNPENPNIPVSNVDAAIAVAAEDPASLITALRMLPQLGMLADLPLDGTAMSLNDKVPVPVPDGVELFAAVKGKNIVFYSGEQGADFSNRVSGDGQEGFVVSSINTEKLIKKVDSVKDIIPTESAEDEELFLDLVESYPRGNISYQIDFTDKGIELEGASDIERPAK